MRRPAVSKRNLSRTRIAARLGLFAVIVLIAALAPSIASPNLARAHTEDASLTALTVTAGGAAQTLSPTFSSTVYSYTVHVDNSVTQVTVAGTLDGDGTVDYRQGPDADNGTDGHQVDLPTPGGKPINVAVSHRVSPLPTTTQIYTVRVIRDGTVATDRAALIALYNSAGGASWASKTNWGSDEPLSSWYGVDTDNNGRVSELYLNHNQLSGSIPDSLGDLTNLERLYLNHNQLSGSIPDSLGDLTSLTELRLDHNQLSGPIPDSLGDLTSLERLELGNNALSGSIPDSLGDLTRLQELRLQRNQLTGPIPDSLGDLTGLERLELGNNALSGSIPDSLGDLTSCGAMESIPAAGRPLGVAVP